MIKYCTIMVSLSILMVHYSYAATCEKKTGGLFRESIPRSGKRIAQYRKERGYSQEALADAIGISRKQVADYETGRVHLNDEMIIRFAVTLNVSADEFLGLKTTRRQGIRQRFALPVDLRDLEKLPEDKKRAVLKVLDDLIRANS